MKEHAVQIDTALVQALVSSQFPQWASEPVNPVTSSGWDNRSFRLGTELLVRMPSGAAYAAQVYREQRALRFLGPRLGVETPTPIALGRPEFAYPWPWSVYRWIPGHTAADSPPGDVGHFAADLADFLNALRSVASGTGPPPGPENFYRGGGLSAYDKQFLKAQAELEGRIDTAAAVRVWESALATAWQQAAVWVHGDIALGNIVLREGRLAGVIDFGQVCVGDPACDCAIAWTYFRGFGRDVFQRQMALDPDTWERGRAWALWKASIVAAGLVDSNDVEAQAAQQTMEEVLAEAPR
jgi:aminoglycoside phosphotransferase (APT) family kinase protein